MQSLCIKPWLLVSCMTFCNACKNHHFALMFDETNADVGNNEETSIILHRVIESFDVNE